MKFFLEIPRGLKWMMFGGHQDFTTRQPKQPFLPKKAHVATIAKNR
jgi:hypothetical protein